VHQVVILRVQQDRPEGLFVVIVGSQEIERQENDGRRVRSAVAED